MLPEEHTNTIHNMTKDDFGISKLDKSNELNETMTIGQGKSQDEVTTALFNL
ncbi:unknown [Streptococcus phage C1]|uniref:Uncharacterized protein n=1 Tax=Streptococcus phage C1 TaxID=2907838 RepID=Q7Y3E5_BPSC1|nr:hypothetical protein C1p17 [Streptococcus phage C1]AAP42316.1 unknown [Streptococcus phage C1]